MSAAQRGLTARKRPGLHRVVITVTGAVLAAGALVAQAPVAGAATSCLVTNQSTLATYSSLQDAVNAAAGGAQLLVSGTCTGTTTISTNLTITGHTATFPRPAKATLNGGGQGTVLTIESSTVALNNLDITGGNAPVTGTTYKLGGGIYQYEGTVTLTDSVVSGNTADAGGGIANDTGTMTLTDTVVSGNIGGGIYNRAEKIGPSPTLTLDGTTIVSDNTSAGDAGGISNDGTLTLNNTVSVTRNTAEADGGGIWNDGTVTFTYRATVTDNTADDTGGGIRNFGTLNHAYAGINVFGNTPNDIV